MKKSVSWSLPLCDVVEIPIVGRGRSLSLHKAELERERKRKARAREISELKVHFTSPISLSSLEEPSTFNFKKNVYSKVGKEEKTIEFASKSFDDSSLPRSFGTTPCLKPMSFVHESTSAEDFLSLDVDRFPDPSLDLDRDETFEFEFGKSISRPDSSPKISLLTSSLMNKSSPRVSDVRGKIQQKKVDPSQVSEDEFVMSVVNDLISTLSSDSPYCEGGEKSKMASGCTSPVSETSTSEVSDSETTAGFVSSPTSESWAQQFSKSLSPFLRSSFGSWLSQPAGPN